MVDPQQPALPPESVILQSFEGLKNTVSRERLKPSELVAAVNVDLDDLGQIRRRRGYTQVSSGNFHSLYTTPAGTIYGVKNGALGIIYPNYSFETLLPGVGTDPLSYVTVGGDTYFSSASTSGVIGPDKIVSRWGQLGGDNTWLSPVINPTATLPDVRGKLLGRPPLATALTYYKGRIYLANGPTLWATELYLYNYVDKTKNFIQFDDNIAVIGSVTDGIYVGTTSAIYWLGGSFTEGMKLQPLMPYGAIPGSLTYAPAELIDPRIPPGDSRHSKNAVVFMTNSGLVTGFDGGDLHNLTQNDVIFPDAEQAAALFRRQSGTNQYIGVLNSGGTPSANTRIGDYVDATIVRFSGA